MDALSTTRKRSKNACRNCRRKKARCPAEKPVCSFCKRLNQVCEYDDPPIREQPPKAESHPRKSKLAERVAELESRIAMLAEANSAASSSMTPSLSPQFREAADVPSNYLANFALLQTGAVSGGRPHVSPPAHVGSNRRNYQILPPNHVVLAAIDAYFKTCHNYPCTFFDETTFRNKYTHDLIPTFLLLTLVASVSRLLIDPWFEDDHAAAAKLIAQAAWQQILTDVLPNDDANSVELVQATGLLSLLDFKGENHEAGTLKLRIAVTIAQTLHLNRDPDHSLRPIEKEERRHLFWTLYLMDRVSALVLDQSYLISDDECSLKLPEDVAVFHTKQRNDLPSLNTFMAHAVILNSNYAKKIIAVSVLGSVVSFCHGSQFQFGRFPLQDNRSYSGLVSQVDRLGEFLQQDTPRRISNSTCATGESENSSQSEISSAFQYYVAKIAFHLARIFINHPFLVRRHPNLLELSCDPNAMHHRLLICQQHAVEVLQIVATAQQTGTLPHTQLFPGWVTFVVAIVHCLFMHSPDVVIAQVSKECFQKAQGIMYDFSLIDGTSQSQRYSIMLGFLGRNAGFASWLVDPSFPRFSHPSKSTSYWRFMDFDWLCEQFCVGANTLSPIISPSVSAPQKPKLGAISRITSSESSVGSTGYALTPQSLHMKTQISREDKSEYIADSRPSQPTSTSPIRLFDLLDDPNPRNHDLMTGESGSQAGPQHMSSVFDSFK